MKFLVLLLELMMIMDIPERSGVFNGVLDGPHMLWASLLKFSKNLLSLMVSRTLKNIDYIAEVDEDHGHYWLRLVSLVTFCMLAKCSEKSMLKIWVKSVDFEYCFVVL